MKRFFGNSLQNFTSGHVQATLRWFLDGGTFGIFKWTYMHIPHSASKKACNMVRACTKQTVEVCAHTIGSDWTASTSSTALNVPT